MQVNGLEPASEEEQQRAAVKIQAGIRGYRDRQRVKALRFVNDTRLVMRHLVTFYFKLVNSVLLLTCWKQ